MSAVPEPTLRRVGPQSAGLRLHRAADPAAPALLWLPAMGVGIGPNIRLATQLADAGVSVAVLEWRGLGDSPLRAGRRCDWGYRELLQEDIAATDAALRAEWPAARVSVGGHSLGGQLALLYAAHAGAALDGLVLAASGHPWWRAFPPKEALGVWAFAAALGPLTATLGHFPGRRLRFAGREARGVMADWSRSARGGGYRVRGLADAEAVLGTLACPVLGLWMDADWLVPRAAVERLRALTPRADWRIDTLDGAALGLPAADHFGWLKRPDAVSQRIADWMARRSHG